ncbi:MAG: glutamate--tRNA ligase family protein [Cyclobacteriaceae bacterium]
MSENRVVSRIAPTPSGLLHQGNAFNFLLTCLLTRYYDGRLWLRIDDIDSARSRPEYVEDIFDTLNWLGIEPDEGPSGPGNFYRDHSQQDKMAVYRKAAERLLDTGKAYACRCSRRKIREASADGIYPETCRRIGKRAFDAPYAVRSALDDKALNIFVPGLEGKGKPYNLKAGMGDFVIWRKDDAAAYQLASLCDDEAMGTTLIVRGDDLFSSSAAQLWLAEALELEKFLAVSFVHHGLLQDESNHKLAKSEGALSIRSMRKDGLKVSVLLRKFCKWADLPEKDVNTLSDLQVIFSDESSKRKLY